jgi:hypothetical protein
MDNQIKGHVVATPKYFIMGRPVNRESPYECIVDPSFPFHESDWNCWHIYLMAGDLRKCFDFYPFPLEWASWERKNVLRFFKMETIKNKVTHEKDKR